MSNYRQLLVSMYNKEVLEDKKLLEGVMEGWIWVPRATPMATYIAMYGVIGCVFRILWVMLVRVPLWWPFHIMAYLINLLVRYTLVPVFAFIQYKQERARAGNHTTWVQMYEYLFWAMEQLEWILKTSFMVMYIVDRVVRWFHTRRTVREYITYRVDLFIINAHTRKMNGNQGRVIKRVVQLKYWWKKNISPLPGMVWSCIKVIYAFTNPLNYRVIRLIVYRKNRERLILIIKCRLIIRYAIMWGWVKYGYTKWIWVKARRGRRIIIHLCKVIWANYHPYLAMLKIGYWLSFNCWWIYNVLYRYIGYSWIYLTGGIRWLISALFILFYPITHLIILLIYCTHAIKMWYKYGWWVSLSTFYLMADVPQRSPPFVYKRTK
jgi:hypothetical protein